MVIKGRSIRKIQFTLPLPLLSPVANVDGAAAHDDGDDDDDELE